jgi:hypothetical protein
MAAKDIKRILSFTKYRKDMSITDQYLDTFSSCKAMNIHADICRSNLLFEVEVDAFVSADK